MSDSPFAVNDARPSYLAYRSRFWPAATYAIIGLNAVVFLVMAIIDASSHPPINGFLLRTFTGVSSDGEFLLRFGASFGPYTRRGEYWRLVMPMFIHIGLIHFLLNNYALYVLGQFLERIYGYGRFAMLYVGAGVGSAFISMSMSDKVGAGASGAIFGIAGVMLVAGYLHRELIPRQWGRAFGKGILPFIVVNLALGFALHQWVDNWAHMGGLATGMVLGLLIPPPKQEIVDGVPGGKRLQALVAIPAILVVLAIGAMVRSYRTNLAVTPLLLQGEVFRSARRDDWALQRFQAAAARSPRDERPHEAMGLIYLGGKHWADAVREYDLALRLNPLSLEAQTGLAQAYREQGNNAKAQENLQAVEKNNPDDADAQYALASLFYQHNFSAEAVAHYQRALRLKPDMPEAQNDLAWLYATSDDPHFRDPQAALQHSLRAVELTHWAEAGFIDTLAEALYANQIFSEAVRVQIRALQLDSRNPELAAHLARYRKAAASPPGGKSSS